MIQTFTLYRHIRKYRCSSLLFHFVKPLSGFCDPDPHVRHSIEPCQKRMLRSELKSNKVAFVPVVLIKYGNEE